MPVTEEPQINHHLPTTDGTATLTAAEVHSELNGITTQQLTAIALGVTTVLSIVFNSVLFHEFYVKLKSLKVNVSFYIYYHLLLSDLILSVICAPFSVYVYAQGGVEKVRPIMDDNKWLLSYCNVSGFAYNVVSKITVQLILILSLDRWLTIFYPQIHRSYVSVSRYRKIIIFLWLYAIFGSGTPFYTGTNYKLRHISQCTWVLPQAFKMKLKKDKWKIFALYNVYINIPQLLPLLFTMGFGLSVIVKLWRIKRRDSRNRKKTSRISYAVNTVIMITAFHIICYALWHYVIVQTTLTIAGVLPHIPMSPLKTAIITSYPIGAFLNATGNPIFLYYRILKQRLFLWSKMSSRSSRTLAVLTSTVNKQHTVLVHKKSQPYLANVEVVKFHNQDVTPTLSKRVIKSVNSAGERGVDVIRNISRSLSTGELSMKLRRSSAERRKSSCSQSNGKRSDRLQKIDEPPDSVGLQPTKITVHKSFSDSARPKENANLSSPMRLEAILPIASKTIEIISSGDSDYRNGYQILPVNDTDQTNENVKTIEPEDFQSVSHVVIPVTKIVTPL